MRTRLIFLLFLLLLLALLFWYFWSHGRGGNTGSPTPTPTPTPLVGMTKCDPSKTPCPPAFPPGWEGVHQFIIADNTFMPAPSPGAVPPEIRKLRQPGAAKVDFLWSGDYHANCWAGDVKTCSGLPADSQQPHPIVGHYVPFAGIQMLANYARCVDKSDCDIAFDTPGDKYECTEMSHHPALPGDDFQPQWTAIKNVYTDANNKPEKVCLQTGTDNGALANRNWLRVEFSYWRRSHPGWLLYTSKDDTMHHPLTTVEDPEGHLDPNGMKDPLHNLASFSGSLPFDVTNEEVATEALGRIARFPHREYYGAISLDTVALANSYGGKYRCLTAGGPGGTGGCAAEDVCQFGPDGKPKSGWCPPVGGPHTGFTEYGKGSRGKDSCPTGYCDPEWTRSVLAWVKRVRDQAHSIGLNLVVNVSYGGSKSTFPFEYIPPDDASLQELFDTVDGVFDEGGFTNGSKQEATDGCRPQWLYQGEYKCGPVNTKPQQRWSTYSAYMLAVQSRGKPYFSKNATLGDGNLLFPPPGGQAEPQPEPQAIPWSLASFLMSCGSSASFARQAIYMAEIAPNNPGKPAVSDHLGYVPYGGPLYNALNVPIGHPCEEKPQSPQPNVFTRQFSGGLVVVNANQPKGASATITLPAKPGVTWPAAAPTSLAAENGVVILATSGKLCE